MRYIIPSLLCVWLVGCGAPAEENISSTTAETASDAKTAQLIIGDWSATDVTIDGRKDLMMDPTREVWWSFRADSSFAMWDASEGTVDTMNGKWRMNEKNIFSMIDPENSEVAQFEVKHLTSDSLRIKVLEVTDGEVLLHFARK